MAELQFHNAAAAGYDRLVGPVSRHFIPFLLRAAHVGLGMRVLDVATGTGLAAEAALCAVGLSGSVAAVDISGAMAERARERLAAPGTPSFQSRTGNRLPSPMRALTRCCAAWG
jgi:ubiquinone/menaquinone biosynthesis C-methylase UbiE